MPEVRDSTRGREQAKREAPWRVLVHNDDYTPAEYVVGVLREIFRLGWWRAATTMLRAHATGVAPVGRYPAEEAQRLVAMAHDRARGDGWPLRFSAEPSEAE